MSETRSVQVVVDSSPSFYEGLFVYLGRGGHAVLGQAYSLEEALQQLATLQANLVVGPNLAETDSLAICREVTARWPAVKIILVTPYADDLLFQADAVEAGAACC